MKEFRISWKRLEKFGGDNRLSVGVCINRTESGYTRKWNKEMYKNTDYGLHIYLFFIKLEFMLMFSEKC